MSSRRKRSVPLGEKNRAYNQLWRVVDGAVADALTAHPDYLTQKGRNSAQLSITKRVTGAVMGFAAQSAKGRSGEKPATESAEGTLSPLSAQSNERQNSFVGRAVWLGRLARFMRRFLR